LGENPQRLHLPQVRNLRLLAAGLETQGGNGSALIEIGAVLHVDSWRELGAGGSELTSLPAGVERRAARLVPCGSRNW
jgi:hypothetical protein